jgi:hypothetical protein
VEYVARKDIGRETDRYVANVHMYYVAYTTSMDLVDKRENQMRKKKSE